MLKGLSKLLVYPLVTPIVVPYRIPHITPFKEFRLQLMLKGGISARLKGAAACRAGFHDAVLRV